MLELLLLAGFYRTVSYLTNALRLPLEPYAARFPAYGCRPRVRIAHKAASGDSRLCYCVSVCGGLGGPQICSRREARPQAFL